MKTLMRLVRDVRLTNEKNEILKIYRENSSSHNVQIAGGEAQITKALDDFFKDENIVMRLILFKDKINKSKRKAEMPLNVFYINMTPDEKKI